MIIGVSGGDLYLGIKLLKDSLQALSSTKGSQKQYTDAVKQLETLEICLKVAICKLSGLEADESYSVVARAITECASCIEGYQRDILSKYEKFFGHETEINARRKFVRELKKIQWLHEKEKTEGLSKAIASHVQIITLACSIGSLPPRTSVPFSGQVPIVLQQVGSGWNPSQVLALPQSDIDTRPEASIQATDPAWKGKGREVIAESQSYLCSDHVSSCTAATTAPDLNSPQDPSRSPSLGLTGSGIHHDYGYSRPHSGTSWQCGHPNMSRSTIATTQSAISIFSRVASDAASVTSRSTATTITLPNQWVDEGGVCHSPACQKRSFVQRKAFSLYVRLSSSDKLAGQWPVGPADARPPKAACEHVLLYLQNMASSESVSEAGCS